MFCTTKGIVLHTIPYSDKYSIIHMYTEAFGRTSYLVTRSRSKKTKVSQALFFPLSVIEMVVDHKNNKDLHRIQEIKSSFSQIGIHSHPIKNSIALFLAELLFRTIHSKESDSKLFGYIYESILFLETSKQGIANFHLVFLLNLVRYMGVFPNTDFFKPGVFFDLLNGVFTNNPPSHPHYLNKAESLLFFRLLRMNYENMSVYVFSGQERSLIIQRIIEYYRLHLSDFSEIKSLTILQALFS